LVPGWRRKILLAVGAFTLPVAIELIQLNLPVLDRTCELADVVDNLAGLVLGLFAGLLAGRYATKSPTTDKEPT
jgi:VanZ family protein